MTFPLKDFFQRCIDLVLHTSGEDVAYCRLVIYDGAFQSTISVDPHPQQNNVFVAATIHHQGNVVKHSYNYGGELDFATVIDGISRSDFKFN
jgi:hypothetical protein